MANINIQDGIISSSADYSLYHGLTKVADVEQDAIRVQGDLIAENYIVSSSVTYMTSSFASGSTIFGNSADDMHRFTGSIHISGSRGTANNLGPGDFHFNTEGDEITHPSLNIFKTCALTSCDVQYTPDGNYMTYEDPHRTLTSYQLSLSFSELDPIFDSDYTALDNDNDTVMGY